MRLRNDRCTSVQAARTIDVSAGPIPGPRLADAFGAVNAATPVP